MRHPERQRSRGICQELILLLPALRNWSGNPKPEVDRVDPSIPSSLGMTVEARMRTLHTACLVWREALSIGQDWLFLLGGDDVQDHRGHKHDGDDDAGVFWTQESPGKSGRGNAGQQTARPKS